MKNKISFNTTMVRLMLQVLLSHSSQSNTFQYHYGSINALQIQINGMTLGFGFNTTMVRLMPVKDESQLRVIQFQYHYGSINAVNRMGLAGISQSVSIPLWFD